MQNLYKFFSSSLAVLGAVVFIGAGYAADSSGRAGYNVRTLNRTGTAQDTSSPRMPTMPTLSINTVGTLSTNLSSGTNGSGGDEPGQPEEPDECPDGGVVNSTYTVENCMNDIKACINNGALSRGINDLFNEDLRNAIINGMGLCSIQVERCVREIRQDCENMYLSNSEVWLDFNARVVQPEYYNFVLRKTGLTPNQAENTCLLLDRNTYGSSFNAISSDGVVTSEYNKYVGAYNSQENNSLSKGNTLGVDVNAGQESVDAQRGHYARWDATTAECLIRVAAYNKGNQIKNSWLFGAVGNDEPAEVWQKTGDTFICNKDLFGFSLMNNTNTVAVVGVGGGTLVGAGIGAIAGHGERLFSCDVKSHREALTKALKEANKINAMNEYITKKIALDEDVMSEKACSDIVKLFDMYKQTQSAVDLCAGGVVIEYTRETNDKISYTIANNCDDEGPNCITRNELSAVSKQNDGETDNNWGNRVIAICEKNANINGCDKILAKVNSTSTSYTTESSRCSFYPLNLNLSRPTDSIYCTSGFNCKTVLQIQEDLNRLGVLFNGDVLSVLQEKEDGNIGTSTLIGAGIGAGTGGLATAITAFVERNNISCHVGDALAEVAYGKSYSIGSLKDFYVKWNLNLPDTDLPTLVVSDCDSWKRACARLTDLNQCKSASANYKPAGKTFSTFVQNACSAQGTECVINKESAQNAGACGVNVGVVDPGVNVGVVDLGNINNNLNAM